MFPTISVLSLGLVAGLAHWLSGRRQAFATWALPAVLLALAVSAPFTAIRPAYAAAALATPGDLPASAKRFDVDYGGVARLLGFELDREQVRPGDNLKVTLYWQTLARPAEDYSIYLQVFGWHQDLGQRDSYPGGGAYPTSLWTPGQLIRDTFTVPITATAKGPAPAWVSAGLYRLKTKEKLPAADAQGKPVIFPILAKISLQTPAATLVPAQAVTADLNHQVRLLGYDLAGNRLARGKPNQITLYWQSTGKLAADVHVFVHVVNERDQIVAQKDGLPLQGFYLPSQWAPGEILNDTWELTVKQAVSAGQYRIYAGLYDPVTGQRLPVLDAAGRPADTQVLVATVPVE